MFPSVWKWQKRVAVCDKWSGYEVFYVLREEASKDPRDKTFSQPTNALEVYQQTQRYSSQTNTTEIRNKSCSVVCGKYSQVR